MNIARNIQVITDIAYLDGERKEKLDLYLPVQNRRSGLSSAIIVIHGRGFKGGDKALTREKNICTNLSNHGYVCASINYKLGTAEDRWSSFPQNLHDVKTAVYFLRKHSGTYGINPEKIGAIGGSAGGTLALLAGMTSSVDKLNPPCLGSCAQIRIQAIVNMYGPTDFSCPIIQSVVPAPPEIVRDVSAINYIHPALPPILTIIGAADELVPLSQAYRLDKALRSIGAYHELKIVKDAGHAFHLQPPQEDIRPIVFSFFDTFLAGTVKSKK